MIFSKYPFFYKLCLILFFNFQLNNVNAQSDSITGIIYDDFGIEIPFVRVFGIDSINQPVKGDISDFDGGFKFAKSTIERIVLVSECSIDTFEIKLNNDYYRIKTCKPIENSTSATCPHFNRECNIYRIIYVFQIHDIYSHLSPLPYRVIYKFINPKEPTFTWKCLTHEIEY